MRGVCASRSFTLVHRCSLSIYHQFYNFVDGLWGTAPVANGCTPSSLGFKPVLLSDASKIGSQKPPPSEPRAMREKWSKKQIRVHMRRLARVAASGKPGPPLNSNRRDNVRTPPHQRRMARKLAKLAKSSGRGAGEE